jgi:hypothetical protein
MSGRPGPAATNIVATLHAVSLLHPHNSIPFNIQHEDQHESP